MQNCVDAEKEQDEQANQQSKINNKKRSEIQLKVLDKIYDQYPYIREFVNRSTAVICREKNF